MVALRNPASSSPASRIRKIRAAAQPQAASKHRSRKSAAVTILRCRRRQAVGFSGSAALDSDGKFADIALLKPVLVAGPPNATPAAQAALVPADTVGEFLKAN